RREEGPRRLLGLPEIDAGRAPVLVVDGEGLLPQSRHPGKGQLCFFGDPHKALVVEALGVLERHEHGDHGSSSWNPWVLLSRQDALQRLLVAEVASVRAIGSPDCAVPLASAAFSSRSEATREVSRTCPESS